MCSPSAGPTDALESGEPCAGGTSSDLGCTSVEVMDVPEDHGAVPGPSWCARGVRARWRRRCQRVAEGLNVALGGCGLLIRDSLAGSSFQRAGLTTRPGIS
jgi:hypothetical protein